MAAAGLNTTVQRDGPILGHNGFEQSCVVSMSPARVPQRLPAPCLRLRLCLFASTPLHACLRCSSLHPPTSATPWCLQSVNLAADDPTNSYMLSAGARICKCLGQEFLPYLSIVMPPLLHSAQLKPDVEVKGSSEDSDEEEDDDEVGLCLTFGSPF